MNKCNESKLSELEALMQTEYKHVRTLILDLLQESQVKSDGFKKAFLDSLKSVDQLENLMKDTTELLQPKMNLNKRDAKAMYKEEENCISISDSSIIQSRPNSEKLATMDVPSKEPETEGADSKRTKDIKLRLIKYENLSDSSSEIDMEMLNKLSQQPKNHNAEDVGSDDSESVIELPLSNGIKQTSAQTVMVADHNDHELCQNLTDLPTTP
jgi:hypothetical protein